jgi:pilus assembly protein Flp/PilA
MVPLLLRDESGVTMVEYGIMISLIAIVCIAAVSVIGKNVSTLFSKVASSI